MVSITTIPLTCCCAFLSSEHVGCLVETFVGPKLLNIQVILLPKNKVPKAKEHTLLSFSPKLCIAGDGLPGDKVDVQAAGGRGCAGRWGCWGGFRLGKEEWKDIFGKSASDFTVRQSMAKVARVISAEAAEEVQPTLEALRNQSVRAGADWVSQLSTQETWTCGVQLLYGCTCLRPVPPPQPWADRVLGLCALWRQVQRWQHLGPTTRCLQGHIHCLSWRTRSGFCRWLRCARSSNKHRGSRTPLGLEEGLFVVLEQRVSNTEVGSRTPKGSRTGGLKQQGFSNKGFQTQSWVSNTHGSRTPMGLEEGVSKKAGLEQREVGSRTHHKGSRTRGGLEEVSNRSPEQTQGVSNKKGVSNRSSNKHRGSRTPKGVSNRMVSRTKGLRTQRRGLGYPRSLEQGGGLEQEEGLEQRASNAPGLDKEAGVSNKRVSNTEAGPRTRKGVPNKERSRTRGGSRTRKVSNSRVLNKRVSIKRELGIKVNEG